MACLRAFATARLGAFAKACPKAIATACLGDFVPTACPGTFALVSASASGKNLEGYPPTKRLPTTRRTRSQTPVPPCACCAAWTAAAMESRDCSRPPGAGV